MEFRVFPSSASDAPWTKPTQSWVRDVALLTSWATGSGTDVSFSGLHNSHEMLIMQAKPRWGCENWGHTNLTVALWLSVKPLCIFFPYRWCPGITLIIEIHSAAADPDESRICSSFRSWPSVNQFKKKLTWNEKLSFKAGWLWACISEVDRDSGYVAFQGKNLKVGVWQYFSHSPHENWHREPLIKSEVLGPDDEKTWVYEYVVRNTIRHCSLYKIKCPRKKRPFAIHCAQVLHCILCRNTNF